MPTHGNHNWLDTLDRIEELEDAEFDPVLVDRLERHAKAQPLPPIRFSTPTFKSYSSSEMKGCSKNSFPAFSITAGACGITKH